MSAYLKGICFSILTKYKGMHVPRSPPPKKIQPLEDGGRLSLGPVSSHYFNQIILNQKKKKAFFTKTKSAT